MGRKVDECKPLYGGIADQGYQSGFLLDLAPTGSVHPYIATGQELVDSARHVTSQDTSEHKKRGFEATLMTWLAVSTRPWRWEHIVVRGGPTVLRVRHARAGALRGHGVLFLHRQLAPRRARPLLHFSPQPVLFSSHNPLKA